MLKKLYVKLRPAPDYHVKYRPYLAIRVKLINGHRRWYRASPKIYNALMMDKKARNLKLMDFTKLIGNYINVPLTPYFGKHNEGKASIGIGKIIFVKFKKMPSSKLCTRSQFVTPDNLQKHLLKSYHYLRHDYGRYSHLQIFVDLYLWRQKLLKTENNKAKTN